MWFENLVGFKEENITQVQSNIEIIGNQLNSKVNGKSYTFGTLEIPTLHELQGKIDLDNYQNQHITISELVGDIQHIHQNTENKGALFQVASQFNLLEMISPEITPEHGIGIYQNDLTQGPACAIACGAGTIYRNYFVPVDQQIGQSKPLQIDCLKELGKALGHSDLVLWRMENGYALPNMSSLNYIAQQITKCSPKAYETLKGKLKIGIQWNTQVTLGETNHLVTQVFSSALPISYSRIPSSYWQPFARLILEATYEASLYTALLNYQQSGNPNVYLTLVGGGAFGNPIYWILESLNKALLKFKHTPLNIHLVSYGSPSIYIQDFIQSFQKTVN